jgi:hypothetical protein
MVVAKFHSFLPHGLRIGIEAPSGLDVGGKPVDRGGVPGAEVDEGFERAHGRWAVENLRDLRLEASEFVDVTGQGDQQARPGSEVDVDGLPGDAGRARDFLQRDRDEVAFLEEPARGSEDGDPSRATP